MKKITIFLLGISLFLAGCQQNEATSQEESGKLKVVATTTMLTDLINQIGGDAIEVEGLMGPGIDPHGYQASSSDVNKLMSADVVAFNGLHLEGKLGEVFENLEKQGKTLFVLEDAIADEHLLLSEDGAVDPHIWFSIENWQLAADYITNQLSEADPDNEAFYRSNHESYKEELINLEAYVTERISELTVDQRYLVTAHDAFRYFGESFDFEVVGLQGINTQTEAGTADVSALAQFITEKEIKALFIESSVSTRTIEALQEAVRTRGWEVEIGGELFSDALGDSSQDAETYVKMFRRNIDTIVDGLK
ncbi:MAG TPA: zinc ABC transporter substrate-binding protein [Candidatus Jeotgalibaca merdavium]|uniref:Zinc ABC transporter solute-binding protein n=2 Tax=Jeotgalibaca TaxID=1470540 RepID=A0A6G7K9J8_9LACT|nr:zinc ABC transporter substrate-binding protein [Jeotgalibaca arthritidis]QII81917.1 zinc ABC transporter solute-binding protein [Jeotgalibaca arthritidis]HJA91167.1 zinc ABC transporter substrate-binding protein [Candidatus Jeotgalibaca merdavium]